MHGKENLIDRVLISTICQPLAVGSVFTCYVYVHKLYVCICFLKYIGLSVPEAVGCAGSLRGNNGEATPSARFYKCRLPV